MSVRAVVHRLGDLIDVVTTTPARGHVLAHDGTRFGNRLATILDVRDWAPAGDGTTDDTAKLQALLTAGAGRMVTIPRPASFYRITAALAVAAKTTVVLEPGTIIEQTTKYTPVFDLLGVDDVVIDGHGALLRWTGSRVYTGGTSFRGGDNYLYGSGVWCNGNRCRIRDLRISGFTCGVNLSAWTGAALTAYSKAGNVVTDLDIDTATPCDFGLLAAGQVDLIFRGVHGGYALQSGGGNPPHLIYISDAVGNRNIVGSDCAARGGDGGHAYSLRGIDGGAMTNLSAYDCEGWVSLGASTGVTITGQSKADAGSSSSASVAFIDGSVARCDLDLVIEMASTEKTVRVQGTGNRVKVKGRVRHPTSSDNYDVLVTGTRNEVDVDLVNVQDDGSDYTTGYRTVGLDTGSGHRATVRRALNTKYAATVASGCTGCSVEIDPAQIVRASSFTVDTAVVIADATAHVVQPRRLLEAVISGPGQTVTVDAMLYDAVEVRVNTADAFTIATPLGGPSHGRMTVMIWNNSGGAMGAITWGGAYTFYTAWANPGATVRKHIAFLRDSANVWREVFRNA